MNIIETSRSAIETYISACQLRHYFTYQFNNGEGKPRGVQPITQSIDPEAGNFAHEVIGHIFSGKNFNLAFELAKEDFLKATPNMSDHKIDNNNPELVQYSIEEHIALVEALTYIWYLTEWEWIKEHYVVVSTEKELRNQIAITKDQYSQSEGKWSYKNFFLLSRVDALLFEPATSNYLTYSLKTTKQLGWFTDAMENRDLQGYMEIWAANQYLEQIQKKKQATLATLDYCDNEPIKKWLEKKFPDGDGIDSVRFCFLIKGDRRPWKQGGDYPHRSNPLIYGYKKKIKSEPTVINEDTLLKFVKGEGIAYAHSFEFHNPANDSGVGRLGKGWEKFKVWEEYEGGIQKWIDNIVGGFIQPEAESPVDKVIKSEIFNRDDELVKATVTYVQQTLLEIQNKVETLETTQVNLFIPNTKNCTIPVLCDDRLICPYSGAYKTEYVLDPLLTTEKTQDAELVQLYQIRVPHHPEGVIS